MLSFHFSFRREKEEKKKKKSERWEYFPNESIDRSIDVLFCVKVNQKESKNRLQWETENREREREKSQIKTRKTKNIGRIDLIRLDVAVFFFSLISSRELIENDEN